MKRKAKRISLAKFLLLNESNRNFENEIKGFGYQVPPDINTLRIYFDQKGVQKVAGNFLRAFSYKTGRPKSASC